MPMLYMYAHVSTQRPIEASGERAGGAGLCQLPDVSAGIQSTRVK